MERILIIDKSKARLWTSATILGEKFGHENVAKFAWDEGNQEEITRQVIHRCRELRRARIQPLVMCNIDGLKSGILRESLKATRHSMHGILATCWHDEMIAREPEARSLRYRWAKRRGTVSYMQCPNPLDDARMNYRDTLEAHLKSLPADNPYHWDEEMHASQAVA